MTVVAEITMSLDGFVTGPHDGQGRGLGEGGEPLHNWVMGGPWTYAGGSPFAASGVDRDVLDEAFGAVGAIIIGRRMYDVVDGWGDSSPFDRPVFVVTRARASACSRTWAARSPSWSRPGSGNRRTRPISATGCTRGPSRPRRLGCPRSRAGRAGGCNQLPW
jgi:hypothetical protein